MNVDLGYPPLARIDAVEIWRERALAAESKLAEIDAALAGVNGPAPDVLKAAAARWVANAAPSEETKIAARIDAGGDPMEALGEWAGGFAARAHVAGQRLGLDRIAALRFELAEAVRARDAYKDSAAKGWAAAQKSSQADLAQVLDQHALEVEGER